MHYKITTLVENAVYRRNLQAEHGLSLLIENNGYKILFDIHTEIRKVHV